MYEIVEHYGIGLLEYVGGLCAFIILFSCIGAGGVISNGILNYLHSIGG